MGRSRKTRLVLGARALAAPRSRPSSHCCCSSCRPTRSTSPARRRRSPATPPTSAASARRTAVAGCRRPTWTARTSWRSTCSTRRATTAMYPRPVPPSHVQHPRHVRQRPELRPVRPGHHRRLLHRHQRRRAEPTVLPQRFLGRRPVQRRNADHGGRGQLRRLQRVVPRRSVPPGPAPGLAEPVRVERAPGRQRAGRPLEQPAYLLAVRADAELHRRHPDRFPAGRADLVGRDRDLAPAQRHPRRAVLRQRRVDQCHDGR